MRCVLLPCALSLHCPLSVLMFCSCAWPSEVRKVFDIVLNERRTKKSKAEQPNPSSEQDTAGPLDELIIALLSRSYLRHPTLGITKCPL
ncbi:hypothetical protein BDP55DRAFT_298437 [Colletotrichum godetiae]|uniref:Secreted protein n=1 Tax=Colletotrichum godetiae TaxID=1209918 RepID=A0AAJ0AEV7_9PEZI|nr:uncharacterized protein BDP55DRAFT_298437 [Colletotrichum godetiae]KAK1671188.1 hypothetical protein BDP55DRAFT_298437 [Colletotrichum godetiae]